MRHGGPERDGPQTLPEAGVVQYPDDARRPLVARPLDAELRGELDDQAGEAPPTQVRLDAEQQDSVALGARDPSMVEGGVGPVDLPRLAVDERYVRPRRLEVEEPFAVDLGEARGAPDAGEKSAGQRCTLAAVVPAAERADQDRPLERRALRDDELVRHLVSLRALPTRADLSEGRRTRPRLPRPRPRAIRARGRATTGGASGTGAPRRPSGRA